MCHCAPTAGRWLIRQGWCQPKVPNVSQSSRKREEASQRRIPVDVTDRRTGGSARRLCDASLTSLSFVRHPALRPATGRAWRSSIPLGQLPNGIAASPYNSGRRPRSPAACSNWWPTRSTVASPQAGPMISSPSGRPVAVKPPHTTSDGIAATFATVVSSGRANPSSGRCSVSSGADAGGGRRDQHVEPGERPRGLGDQVGAPALRRDVVGRTDQRARQHPHAEHARIVRQPGLQRRLVQRVGLGAR